jgi:DNA-binding NarL/FixJ family response regulator
VRSVGARRRIISSEVWEVAMNLSPREREVALLVAHGRANKEIGRELGLSPGTVKQHVHNIFLKLGTRNRCALIHLLERHPAVTAACSSEAPNKSLFCFKNGDKACLKK